MQPVYMIKTKAAFLEGRLFSSQSDLLRKLLIALIGWIKGGPQKSHFCFDHVNRLMITSIVAGFQSRLFFSQPFFFISKAFELPLIGWKKASIESRTRLK